MTKFLSNLYQRWSRTHQCYLLWLWCSLFSYWCSCGSFLFVATTACDAKNAMAWYVVYWGKEPGVYATWPSCHAQVSGFANCCYKCLWNLLAVLRATNQALKYLVRNCDFCCSWFAGSTIVMFMSLEALRSLSMPSLLNGGKVISVSLYSSSFCNSWW